jgi:lipopolysaccharide export system protein LptA
MVMTARLFLAGAIAAFSLTAAASAQQQTPSDTPINISAKASEYLQKEGRGVYSGDVIVTRGNARITTDKLTLVCTKPPTGATRNECEDVEQIVAEGNVLYTAPDVKIRGDKAVYQYGAGIITITGDVILSSGNEGVTRGTEVVYNVDAGAVKATAGNNRVLSIITPKKKDGAVQPAAPAAPATPPN